MNPIGVTRRGAFLGAAAAAATIATAVSPAHAQEVLNPPPTSPVTVTERPAPTETPAPAAPPIGITIDGEPLAFTGQAPVQRAGTVLVPLRGVFERLGASVQYDPASKIVVAIKGERTVTLRLGDSVATVDGEPRPLAIPAQAENGATLVPLRFVSEALGAEVKWDGAQRIVRIATGMGNAGGSAADLPLAPGRGPVSGVLTGVVPDAKLITVRLPDGRNTRIPYADDSVVLVQVGKTPAVRGAVADLKTGDQVTVRRDAGTGVASLIELFYEERRGELRVVQPMSATGGHLLTLGDGQVVELTPEAIATAVDGRPVAVADVPQGTNVLIRVNPQTGQGVALAVVVAEAPPMPEKTDPLVVGALTLSSGAAPLRAGETLTVTLRGTPGAQGTFTVPGLAGAENGVPMKEQEAGVYTGTFMVPENVTLKGAAVLASLSRGGMTSNTIQAGQTLSIDGAGPTLANLAPAGGSNQSDARPLIYGTYTDVGSGIAPKGVQVLVNGTDVTAQADVTEAFFSYRPTADLPAGENIVVLVAHDQAGNEARQVWRFMVTPASSIIKTLSVSPADETLGPGDTLTIRIDAPAGGKASFSVAGTGITDKPLREEGAGMYVGTYEVQKGDTVTKAPITVTFAPANGGKAVTKTAAQSVTIAAGVPGIPVIDTPQENASVGESLTITGRAAPGATVRLTVRYSGKLLILGTGGTVVSTEVKADKNGQFRSGAIKLSAPRGVSSLTYTLEAVILGAGGEESAPATVRFKR